MQAPSGISLPDDKKPVPTPLSKPVIFATSQAETALASMS